MKEIWKTREDLNNIYISNLGNYKRGINGEKSHNKPSHHGYVYIMIDGKKKLMHRLVAELFCQKSHLEKNIVDHINGLRNDNRSENLRWVSSSENNRNKRKDGVIIKDDNNRSKDEIAILFDIIKKQNEQIKRLNENFSLLLNNYSSITKHLYEQKK